jgi:small subunit ribosomal protein SAe
MKRYVSHRGEEGAWILNLEETWQKIKLAARAIAAVENDSDVIVTPFPPHN